jgi:hypothetical protein
MSNTLICPKCNGNQRDAPCAYPDACHYPPTYAQGVAAGIEMAARVCDDLQLHNDVQASESASMGFEESTYYHDGAWKELKKAAAAIRALPQQGMVCVDWKDELGNLLARIHRDGGHYVDEHGWRKAIDDADTKVINLFAIEAEVERLRADAERLDWCDEHLDYVSIDGYGADDRWCKIGHHDGNLAEGATLREAIDAAKEPK